MNGTVVDTPVLLRLGLAEQTAKVWQAMLDAPGADVAELAEVLGLTESQVRSGLDELADLALVRASRQTTGLLVAVAPEAGLELLVRRQERELAEQRRRIEEGRDEITRALATRLPDNGARTGGGVEHLIGPDAIQNRFEQLAYSTTESADVLSPGAARHPDTLEAARPLDTDVLARGINIRIVYQDAIRNHTPTAAYARDLAALGATVRTAPLIPQRLFLCDRRIALVPLDPADPTQGAACVSDPAIIHSLQQLFDYAWHHSTPLDLGNPVDTTTGLTDTERALLTLLAQGLTDEAAGKRLSISLRTVRRIMADLMTRLDATSRFEAGIKAAKRGWL